MHAEGEGAAGPEELVNEYFAAQVAAKRPLWHQALHDPRGLARTLLRIRRLPHHRVHLPPVADAGAVRAALLAHSISRRATLGVVAALETPDAPDSFLLGPRRATVRRKVRQAQRAGTTVRPVAPEERTALVASADHHERANPRHAYRITKPDNADLLQHDLWLVGEAADGTALLLAVIPVAGEWAVLRYFRTLTDDAAASDARYLATSVLAEELRRRGVRFLVDTSRPHWLPNGLRHFQRMVGFRLIRLSVDPPRAVTGRRDRRRYHQ